jgi:hypothetical protein
MADLSAARHSDCLFVKDKGGENDLKAYCVRLLDSCCRPVPHSTTGR